jgi:uncharacterized protein DUF6610
MAELRLIFCLGANRQYPAIARRCGWSIGARLPCTLYAEYQPLAFADQDWRRFDGLLASDDRYRRAYQRYIAAVASTRPHMASVLDWTADRDLSEVLDWAVAIAPSIETVQIIPKVPGRVGEIPRTIAGRPVILGYSVPTRHGATPCDPAEFAGWPVHLLGGNPRQQIHYAGLLTTLGAEIVSADGNLTHKAAGLGTFWEAGRARNLGARKLSTLAALTRSLIAVPQMWRAAGWALEQPYA